MATQVLLADDHQIVRQGIRAMLEHEGFRVVGEAADGREAVRMAETTRPDVAILDLAMPGLNGLDSARDIQKRVREQFLKNLEDGYFVAGFDRGDEWSQYLFAPGASRVHQAD